MRTPQVVGSRSQRDPAVRSCQEDSKPSCSMGDIVEDRVPELPRLKPGMDLSGKVFRQDGWELAFGISPCTSQHRERSPDGLDALGRFCVGGYAAVLGLSFSLAAAFGAGLSFAAMVSTVRRLGCGSPIPGPLRCL